MTPSLVSFLASIPRSPHHMDRRLVPILLHLDIIWWAIPDLFTLPANDSKTGNLSVMDRVSGMNELHM